MEHSSSSEPGSSAKHLLLDGRPLKGRHSRRSTSGEVHRSTVVAFGLEDLSISNPLKNAQKRSRSGSGFASQKKEKKYAPRRAIVTGENSRHAKIDAQDDFPFEMKIDQDNQRLQFAKPPTSIYAVL